MKRVLFIGGTSCLGRELIKELSLDDQYKISVLIRSPESASKLSGAKVQFVLSDELHKLPPQDLVFNLVVDYGRNNASLSDLINTNCLFPLKALEKIIFKTVLNFSTGLSREVSPYALSKGMLEEALGLLGTQRGAQVLNLKLQHFYGPAMPEHNFLAFLLTKMRKNEELQLTDGLQRRDFIHIHDVVDATRFILGKLDLFGISEAIEIGTGDAVKVRDLVEELKVISGSSSQLTFGAIPRRKNEPEELRANTSKLSEMGWRPKITLSEGLRDLTKGP